MSKDLETPKELRARDARLAALVGYTNIRQLPDTINGGWWGQPPAGWVSAYGLQIPDFSSDWYAAGLLADWLHQADWLIDVSTGMNGWTVSVRTPRDDGVGVAPTFPEALSRAVDEACNRTVPNP